MDKSRVKKAQKMIDSGKSMGEVAHDSHVHVSTLRRWLRNYERYGDSLWTGSPKEVERE
jgi:transposase